MKYEKKIVKSALDFIKDVASEVLNVTILFSALTDIAA